MTFSTKPIPYSSTFSSEDRLVSPIPNRTNPLLELTSLFAARTFQLLHQTTGGGPLSSKWPPLSATADDELPPAPNLHRIIPEVASTDIVYCTHLWPPEPPSTTHPIHRPITALHKHRLAVAWSPAAIMRRSQTACLSRWWHQIPPTSLPSMSVKAIS